MNLIYTFPPYVLKTHFNIILQPPHDTAKRKISGLNPFIMDSLRWVMRSLKIGCVTTIFSRKALRHKRLAYVYLRLLL
jgi:hypothetical protein